jgi:transcription-repair coupling factor (superfamily II helicase)
MARATSLLDFLTPLRNAQAVGDLCAKISACRHAVTVGHWGSAGLALAAITQQQLRRPMIVVVGHLDEADDAVDMLEYFVPGARAVLYPAYEVLPGESNISYELAVQRLDLLAQLHAQPDAQPEFIIAPIQALMQPAPGPHLLAQQLIALKTGQTYARDTLIHWLGEHGYTRLDAVEDAGDFAVRGDILDVWPPGDGQPLRIDFFGDQIESLARFDLETMGTIKVETHARLVALGDRATWPVEDTTHLLKYMAKDTLIWLLEPTEIQEQGRSYYQRLDETRGTYSPQAVLQNVQQFAWVELHQFAPAGVADVVRLPCQSLMRFDTQVDAAVRELAELAQRSQTLVVCDSKGDLQRLTDLLEVKCPGAQHSMQMQVGALGLGFGWEEPLCAGRSLTLVGHHELFHRYTTRRRLRSVAGAKPLDTFLDLQPGDYVVHVQHGIAKFEGMKTIARDGMGAEYLTLKFSGESVLQVPVTQIHLVQKYVGSPHGRPTLSALGGTSWNKQKEKVSEAVVKLAGDLLAVQAARAAAPGVAYPADTAWTKEFEEAFPYPPTEDQVRCTGEIKNDLALPRPMDRLLCGDVGYGKTELAMRAAFKVCEFGKQVAVLVPTTVLCEQHEKSFRNRMAGYPFVINSVSRFKTPKEVKLNLEAVRTGQVDILIGTHRLLSKDVSFADLGLVIIDEEQRFGVEHKERLKQLRMTVDVLTLTATPIPRTLHMSMLGIRDISNLSTPPMDRRSVVTEVIPYDRARIHMAIQRELARDGQIYFVHNRVWNIQSVADDIRQMAPGARIGIGHGQMADGELEDVMHKFINHELDILVCTTIIESGLDIPNANTMIINEAEHFGLSGLHQLRGRVGRWKHRAYCYLLLSPDKTISSTAAKRLKAMEEYASLGAGFKIALRDLEIRGAGNILGPEQSGHITAVGYEMYCQLLEEAVKKMRNEPILKPIDAVIEIGVTGSVPRTYIESDRQRMDIYRRLGRCHTLEQVRTLEKDMVDAFGALPKSTELLLMLAELKIFAEGWGVSHVLTRTPDVVFTLSDLAKLGPLMGTKGPGSVRVADARTVHLRLPPQYLEPQTLLVVLRNMLNPEKVVVPPPAPAAPAPKPATSSPLGRRK